MENNYQNHNAQNHNADTDNDNSRSIVHCGKKYTCNFRCHPYHPRKRTEIRDHSNTIARFNK